VTIARSLSDTFAGIRPADVPLFIAAQVAGGIAATLLFRWLGLNSRIRTVVLSASLKDGTL
jgi:glycerol uptake facilitator-like aquaporin